MGDCGDDGSSDLPAWSRTYAGYRERFVLPFSLQASALNEERLKARLAAADLRVAEAQSLLLAEQRRAAGLERQAVSIAALGDRRAPGDSRHARGCGDVTPCHLLSSGAIVARSPGAGRGEDQGL